MSMLTATEIEQTSLMTLEDFVRLYDAEGPFEIVNGERVALMPPVAIHVLMTNLLAFLLRNHCYSQQLGEVFSEAPFVKAYNSNWVKGARVPDVMFFAAERWNGYIMSNPDWAGQPFVLIPDLAVEVLSMNDSFTDVQDKVEGYLRDGVRLVWVVDPQRERVIVYQGDHFATLAKTDTLTGGEVIPGFSLPLTEIFKDSYRI